MESKLAHLQGNLRASTKQTNSSSSARCFRLSHSSQTLFSRFALFFTQADLPPIPAALDKGSELISRGLDKSAAALAAAWDKLGPLARWYYEHVFDQTPLTQLARCFYLTLGLQMLAGFLPHAVMGKEGQYRFLSTLHKREQQGCFQWN